MKNCSKTILQLLASAFLPCLALHAQVQVTNQSPATDIQLRLDGIVLAKGAYDPSLTAMPNEAQDGARMLWYPARAAFRAGFASGDYYNPGPWGPVNLGLYSFATGYDAKASGSYSFAAGYGSSASSTGAIAIGSGANAGGFGGEIALGPNAVASAYGTAIDPSTLAYYYGTALGKSATAGADALALGAYVTANY